MSDKTPEQQAHELAQRCAEKIKRDLKGYFAVTPNSQIATIILHETGLVELVKDAEIGRSWQENSSLEKWFPFSAEELRTCKIAKEALHDTISQLRAELEKAATFRNAQADAMAVLSVESTRLRAELLAAKNEIARLNGQTNFVCECGGTKVDVERLRAELDKYNTIPAGSPYAGTVEESGAFTYGDWLRNRQQYIDEAERLRAELADVKAGLESAKQQMVGLRREVQHQQNCYNAAKSALEEARKDRERLDWLESKPVDGFIMAIDNTTTLFDWSCDDKESLRTAIDAAMQKDKQ